jgi:hypothetical protein
MDSRPEALFHGSATATGKKKRSLRMHRLRLARNFPIFFNAKK